MRTPLELLLAVIILGSIALTYRVSFSPDADVPGPQASAHEETAALESSLEFLRLLDSGRVSDTWSHAAPDLQRGMTSTIWEGMISSMRGMGGPVVGRSLRSSFYTEDLEDAPPGRYFVIDFETEFQNLSVVERVVPKFENGEWKISGYHFQQSFPAF